MNRSVTLLFFALMCSGCASSKPLPSLEHTASPVEFADLLIAASKVGTSNPTARGEEVGYRWSRSRWCANHDQLAEQRDLAAYITRFCNTQGGRFDGDFCRAESDSDVILFAGKVGSSDRCGSVYGGKRSLTLEIVEPTSGASQPNYIAKLRSRGYQTRAEAKLQRERDEQEFRRREERRQAEFDEREAQRKAENEARRQAMSAASIGTRICRFGVVEYILQPGGAIWDTKTRQGILIAQLDGLAENASRIRFRILEVQIPSMYPGESQYSHSFRMGQFVLEPGAVYWDLSSNWTVC